MKRCIITIVLLLSFLAAPMMVFADDTQTIIVLQIQLVQEKMKRMTAEYELYGIEIQKLNAKLSAIRAQEKKAKDVKDMKVIKDSENDG